MAAGFPLAGSRCADGTDARGFILCLAAVWRWRRVARSRRCAVDVFARDRPDDLRPQYFREAAAQSVAAALQAVIPLVVCFAPPPVGFGSDVPGPVMMDSQVILLAFCFLASNADAANPGALWVTGAAIILVWIGARHVMLADPGLITAASLHPSDLKDPLSLLRVQNDPHYFNGSIWGGGITTGATITAALGLSLYRTRRLARMAAEAEAWREALAAFFSPQVTEEIMKSRSRSLPPHERRVAVLDCDLVGFTSLAELLAPEQAAAVLRAWRSVVEDAVFAEDGALLSHTGDGSVALFGFAEQEQAEVARACAAARRVLQAWPAAVDALQPAPLPAIGIDFGTVRVGLLGERMLSFVAVGDALDCAAELQRETRNADVAMLIGDAAFAEMKRQSQTMVKDFEPYEADRRRAWKMRHAEAG